MCGRTTSPIDPILQEWRASFVKSNDAQSIIKKCSTKSRALKEKLKQRYVEQITQLINDNSSLSTQNEFSIKVGSQTISFKYDATLKKAQYKLLNDSWKDISALQLKYLKKNFQSLRNHILDKLKSPQTQDTTLTTLLQFLIENKEFTTNDKQERNIQQKLKELLAKVNDSTKLQGKPVKEYLTSLYPDAEFITNIINPKATQKKKEEKEEKMKFQNKKLVDFLIKN